MDILEFVLGQDIVLDQDVFQKTSDELTRLSGELVSLRKDIRGMLDQLLTGFDTPAGHKLVASCENHLLSSLDDQKLVLDHVANNLILSKNKYQTVFDDYEELNNTIKNLGN